MVKEHYRPGLEIEDPRHWTPIKRIETEHYDFVAALDDYFRRRPARIKKTGSITEVEAMITAEDRKGKRPLTAEERSLLRTYKTKKERVSGSTT